jgi:hypothetical protein
VCHCQDTDVVLIALKCLMSFLRFDLPSIPLCARSLGTQTLKLLTSSSGTSNYNHDLIQACFKTLTYLISMDKKLGIEDDGNSSSFGGGEHELVKGVAMLRHSKKMQVLISLLKVSIAESEQHNPALVHAGVDQVHYFPSLRISRVL